MMTTTWQRPPSRTERERFWHLVHAEWTKFRTVRGWVIAVIVAVVVMSAFVFLAGDVGRSCGGSSCAAVPIGPGGEPVQDAFFLAHQPLTGNGTITVRLESLSGQVDNGPSQSRPDLQPWAKAGIVIKENTSQGSAYAAIMVTGSHGVRMQWNYVHDTPGMAGAVSAASPRWLRLVRAGDTITGYDSADGTHWTPVATATLSGLTSTVQSGLFAAAPSNGATATATGAFTHIALSWPSVGWISTNIGGTGENGVPAPGSLSQNVSTLTVTGSGDIGPLAGDGVLSIQRALDGTYFGLILLIVVGAMFITAEYRRGLIHTSLTASPHRGRLLAAKGVVLGTVSFVTGVVAAALSVAIGSHTLASTGVPLWPVSTLTEARMILGTGALLAVAAVLTLAIGTILRRSAPAITTAIALIFIPFLLAVHLQGYGARPGHSGGGEDWLLQVTPAAALSVQQVVPRFTQVSGVTYTPDFGYFPLSPWAGLAVECAWAAAALVLAWQLLRRRDA